MAEHLDPASFVYGLALGVTCGAWLRRTLDALRSMGPPRGRYGLPPDHDWRRRGSNPPPPGRKPAPPPAPGMRREYIWNAAQMAECGGPCWEAQDPRCCDCGGLWRDVPRKSVTLTEGPVQRGQGNGGPSTPKLVIVPAGVRRRFIPNPDQVAECGGPCQLDPLACDCWLSNPPKPPIKPQPCGGRMVGPEF